MRILHVVASSRADGRERAFLDVLEHVRAEDPAVDHRVVAVAETSPLPECDVVHVVSDQAAYSVLPRLMATSAIPVVYSKSDDDRRWAAGESMLSACDSVTFTTSQSAAAHDVPMGRATILGKAADLARFQGIPAPPPPSTPQRILCVAPIEPRSRLDDLAHALVEVRRHVPDAELRLVGEGAAVEAERLTALADSLGISDVVTLAGAAVDIAAELEDARILALAAPCEGVPASVLGGMAAGRPVVGTTAGHVGRVVDDGREGFLVVPGDVDALGRRLAQLLADRPLAAAMGQAARRRSAEHDVRVVARRLLRALCAAA